MSLENDYLNAISRGHYEQVIYFIKNGINVNIKDQNGETGISKAMKNGYKEIVKYLLQKGVNIKDDKNLIFMAAEQGYLDIVISLLKYENSSKRREEALNIAEKVLNQKELAQGIQEQNINKITKAIDNGADVNYIDILSWSPLMNAVLKANSKITNILIENNANINYRNNNNETSLYKAVEVGDSFVVKTLLENGANPNIKDNYQNTPIIIAVKHGDLDIIKLLIKYDAEINIKNIDNETPIEIAIKNNHIEIVEFFMKKGMKLNNYLELAYENKHYYLTEQLLRYENNYAKKVYFVDLLNSLDIKTRLEIKIKKNNLEEIKRILKNNICTNMDELLFMAVKASKYRIVNYLALSGANSNAYMNNLSPLMVAVSRGDIKMVKVLLTLGANVNGKGNFILGFPLTIAINEGYFNILKLLIENGADIHKSYGFKLSAIEEARQSNNMNIVDYFKNIE